MINMIRVLCCDDDEFNLVFAEMILAGKCEYTLATNGREAIEYSRKMEFDIILMDITMPEIDGIQAMKEIRRESLNQTTPIAAVTALAMTGDRERLLSYGFDQYLSKPFKEDDLIHLIMTASKNQ